MEFYDPGDEFLHDSCTPEDKKTFCKILNDNHLPSWNTDISGEHTPACCGPHSLKHIRRVCEIVRPKLMLEIGFNIGWSASLWLTFSETKLISVDISRRVNTFRAARLLAKNHPGRFQFIPSDSKAVLPVLLEMNSVFDLAFIDGDHTVEGVDNDVQVALALKSPFIFFDDCISRFGPGTAPAIEKYNLEVIEVMENMVLTKPRF